MFYTILFQADNLYQCFFKKEYFPQSIFKINNTTALSNRKEALSNIDILFQLMKYNISEIRFQCEKNVHLC